MFHTSFIYSITYNDLGVSYGPAVHYLELWNNFSLIQGADYSVKGVSPCWMRKPSIITEKFKVKKIFIPKIPRLRQIFYDLSLFPFLLKAAVFRQKVYIRLPYFCLFTLFLCVLFRVKYILELNGIASYAEKKSSLINCFLAWQERKMIKYSSAIISVSGSIAAYAKKFATNKVYVLKNGVNDRLFDLPLKKCAQLKTIIYVGTFTPWDGAGLLPKLAKQYPSINFLIVGDGVLRPSIQLASPENVRFVGAVPYSDLPEYYRQADAGIVLYDFMRHAKVELSSLKCLEYAASGLPIYTTNVPGQEWIKNNNVGYCAEEGEEIDGFSNFLEKFSSYQDSLERYRPLLQQERSWKAVAEKTLKIIKDC